MESSPRLSIGTINIALLHGRTSLTTRVWVQSLGMGMRRCQAPNPTRSVSQLLVIMSYVLISLMAHSILLSILTHTLAYIYHAHHIILSKATNNKISQGQKHWYGNIKETCDCILDIKKHMIHPSMFNSSLNIYISISCSYGCMTYLIASQYLCINEQIFECMFMVLKQEKKRKTQSSMLKTNKEQRNRDSKT